MSNALLLLIGAAGTLVTALAGAFVSLRLLRPRQEQLIAETRSTQRSDDQKLLERYERWVDHQAQELEQCARRIDELEVRERECEARNMELARRVAHLEDIVKRAGLNGDV